MHKSMINYVAIVCEVFRCGGLWLVKPLRRISADFVLPRFVHLLYVSAAKLGRMCSVSHDPVHLESVSMKRIRRNKNILLFFPSSVAFPKSNLFDVWVLLHATSPWIFSQFSVSRLDLLNMLHVFIVNSNCNRVCCGVSALRFQARSWTPEWVQSTSQHAF